MEEGKNKEEEGGKVKRRERESGRRRKGER